MAELGCSGPTCCNHPSLLWAACKYQGLLSINQRMHPCLAGSLSNVPSSIMALIFYSQGIFFLIRNSPNPICQLYRFVFCYLLFSCYAFNIFSVKHSPVAPPTPLCPLYPLRKKKNNNKFIVYRNSEECLILSGAN